MKSKFILLKNIHRYSKKNNNKCTVKKTIKKKIRKKTKNTKLSKKKIKKIFVNIDRIKFSFNNSNGKTFKKKK